MKFIVKAVKTDGEHFLESRNAPDKESLLRELRVSGDTPISITEEIETVNNKFQHKLQNYFHHIIKIVLLMPGLYPKLLLR